MLALYVSESARASTDGQIRIRVNDEQGIALPGAAVRLDTASATASVPVTQADEAGFATLDHLETDRTYTLRVSFPGFVPLR